VDESHCCDDSRPRGGRGRAQGASDESARP
jgi:hypothetical protein